MPVCFTTMQALTEGLSAMAASAAVLSGVGRPPRRPVSAVIMTVASALTARSRSASAEKPPNTTQWMAPMRAQASMATGSSGIMGR